MTDQEINIAVAEACGIDTKRYQTGGVFHYRDHRGHMIAALPNYVSDLNACREMECHITVGQIGRYLSSLTNIVQPKATYHPMDLQWWTVRATARQRCEAFLRTIGKWKEESK